ncbi:unnamed protein product [Bursaphelenchus xylophilus]|uniref:(pine wood nematode) hypothetical protein n=1 Tax=Bursaphelenchus xylophilus TaxID=6326 RepID=A0A1I7RWQ9_BURXY|nr:unnamed protein product [Bursaphelenchus xylophilus]CAG9128588.1 unnamed protein product [Bursaphelenchus xylophilus]
MHRKRTSLTSLEVGPEPKKSVIPTVLSSAPSINRTQPSRFVSQSYLKQPYNTRHTLFQNSSKTSSLAVPTISSVKTPAQQVKPVKPSESVESTSSFSKPTLPECSFAQPADPRPSGDCEKILYTGSSNINQEEIAAQFQTLDFQTAGHAPIKLLASKLNAARSLLREVDITDREEVENTNLIPKEIRDFPDSLEQDLDVDWASVGKSIEEKLNETA